MKTLFVSLLTFVFLLPGMGLAEDSPGKRLGGNEIKQLFTDTTAACIKEKDRSSCVTYMGADGSVKRLTHSNSKVRKGHWHIDGTDRLCIRWAGKKKDLCFDVTQQRNMTYELYKKGKLRSTIIGLMVGDKIGDFSGQLN